jgi:hypothetical protein
VDQPSLDDAFDKLGRAKHHFELLRSEIQPFEERDAHRITVDVDANAGTYVLRIRDLGAPNPLWGLIVGDCLHNARTALDYVAVNLWAYAMGTDPRDVSGIAFPIYDDPQQPPRTIAKMRKELAFSGYLTRIEEVQPFNHGNPSVWGTSPLMQMHALPIALRRLSELDTIDKHRVIHAVWAGIDWVRLLATGDDSLQPPAEFVSKGGQMEADALENDAEVARWEFETPLPFAWQPDEMDMKRNFPVHIALANLPGTHNLLEILALCLWGTEAILTLFNPVFTGAQAPLPVTAIPNLS